MTTGKVPAHPARVSRSHSPQRNVGIIFSTVGFLLWVAIWSQALRGTREARALDIVFPVVFTAISLLFTIRAHRAD